MNIPNIWRCRIDISKVFRQTNVYTHTRIIHAWAHTEARAVGKVRWLANGDTYLNNVNTFVKKEQVSETTNEQNSDCKLTFDWIICSLEMTEE